MQRWLLLSAWMLFGTSLVLKSGAADWYVALDGTGQGTGGWESATNDLQGAIDACVAGDTVWVSNGVYQSGERLADLSQALSNRVVITKPITVRSLSDDPAQTVIKGRWDSVEKNGPAAVRCVYVSIGAQDRALLSGFTFTNGATLTASADDSAGINQRGGGIYAASSGELIVSNCIIAGNSAFGQGGGAYGPALSVYDSVFVGNAVRAGISSYRKAGGGGACACKLLSNCLLTNNAGDYGSAAGSIQQMHNCLVVSNKSLYAVYSSTLYNCLVANNTSSYAVRDGRLYNCTVANNSGYGLYHEVVAAVNTVVYFNTRGNCYKLAKPKPMMYCCTTPPLPDWETGDGNITDEPLFANMGAGDLRLNRDSPCINAGTNGVWTVTGADFDGNSRIDRVSGLVDMGCYEYDLPYPGTILLVQ